VGIPRTRGLLYSPWLPLRIPSTITPIGQLHQSPPSPIPGDRARGKRRCFPRRSPQESDWSFHVIFFAVFHSFRGSCGFCGQFSRYFEIRCLPLDFFEIWHSCKRRSTYSNTETRMDRPKSVVRVIWGVVLTVHVSHLFIGSSSGMYGIRYCRVFDYVSVS